MTKDRREEEEEGRVRKEGRKDVYETLSFCNTVLQVSDCKITPCPSLKKVILTQDRRYGLMIKNRGSTFNDCPYIISRVPSVFIR